MQFKRLQKQVGQLSEATEQSIERNVFGRFARLVAVRRFVFGWVTLMLLLIGGLLVQFQHLSAYYQSDQPIDGGIYSEGIVGSISNVNPVYATSDVDRSLSRLLFAGLMGYDDNGQLVPRLAQSIEASQNGRVYDLKLRPGLTWHDGKPITSRDAAFTFNTIKKADAQSPLLATWQNVTVTAPDAQTVRFRLPSALASFPYTLTTGLIPEHILGDVAAGALRSSDFNTTKPIGAGPFSWRGLQVNGERTDEIEEQVAMLPFDKYVAGKPKLGEFVLRAYASPERLQSAFASGQLTAVAGLTQLPADAPESSVAHDLLLKAGNYVFFKTNHPVLSSVKVRQALVAAADPTAISSNLSYMTRPVVSPLLSGQLGYDKKYAQKTNDLATAKRLLSEDGWTANGNSKLSKAGQSLSFNVVFTDTPEYRRDIKLLTKQWQAIGVSVQPRPLSPTDYATALASHDYDATLYGISIGEDPDVYGYWHSSQADVRSSSRLNISEWKNKAADQALEAGRTRADANVRAIKYAPFLQAWQQEAPALGLYQPRSLYITRGPLYGLTQQTVTSSIDRYNGVENWQIRSARVTN